MHMAVPLSIKALMMVNHKKVTKLKSLSHGRPPTVKPAGSISRKATRALIRNYHILEKQRTKALGDGDITKAAAFTQQIEAQGGIKGYQRASLLGQTKERGGDSSRILMEWLEPFIPDLKGRAAQGEPLRLLEVGALSVENACAKSRAFEVVRIDLNSQADEITQQDFMERPLPVNEREKFDIISLSLVLNFVPNSLGKGEMLLRTLKFLKIPTSDGLRDLFPCLFLVLPATCVTNSRYMDEAKFEDILRSLGYECIQKKLSTKLVYYIWRLMSPISKVTRKFKKEEIRSGRFRNNFAIVLR